MFYFQYYTKSDPNATANTRGSVASIEAWESDSYFTLAKYSIVCPASTRIPSHHPSSSIPYRIIPCLVSRIPYYIIQQYQSIISYCFLLLLWYPYFYSFPYAFKVHIGIPIDYAFHIHIRIPNQFKVPNQIRLPNQTSERIQIQGRAYL